MHNCPICRTPNKNKIFQLQNAPAFQNKTYATLAAAEKAVLASVDLVECGNCGFAWNQTFDSSLMDYDENYQNEQGYSDYFQKYLMAVLEIIKSHTQLGDSVVEVGCGKGKFLKILRDAGFKVTGFDPAYEGSDPDVTCDYFDASLNFPPAEMVVLRHTLEHIPNPLNFLHTIRNANGGKGKIFIEVPCFNWIERKKAFWDIFHEHCNYFTAQSLGSMFSKAETGSIFGGQYLYLIADLSTLKKTITIEKTPHLVDASLFSSEIARLQSFVERCEHCLIWGAGAKGAAFAHLADPNNRHIEAIIDINPKKQGCFFGKTGHPIIGPENLENFRNYEIIIMNENYRSEIEKLTSKYNVKLHTLGDI